MDELSLLTGERRRFQRHPVRKPVEVLSTAGTFARTTGMTENLSSGGVLLLLEAPLATGFSVALLFDMPTQAGNGTYPVRCIGTVLRTEPFLGKHAVAVSFEKIDMLGQA